MMVIFLTGLVAMIMLRTLRRDYARYTQVRPADARRGRPRCQGQHATWLVKEPASHPPR